MPMTDITLRLRVIPAIADVTAAAWDACANPLAAADAAGVASRRRNSSHPSGSQEISV